MPAIDSKTADRPRVRRARRQDVGALLDHVGGPPAGRLRAARRLLKTLAADVYVVDRAGTIEGLVAIHYRRSLASGGLVATIDAMESFRPGPDRRQEDVALLLDCALGRASRRGCVEIDVTAPADDVRRALERDGFVPGPPRLARSLREEEGKG